MTTRTRALLALPLAAAGLVGLAAPASAAPNCTSEPRDRWMPEADMRARVEQMGYRDIRTFKVSGNCYEIYGFTRDGRRAEVYFNPVTGAVVEEKAG